MLNGNSIVKKERGIRLSDVLVCGIACIVVLMQILKLGDLPGLYLDAINPDYTAVQVLFPQENQEKWMIAWPWLGQLYHGNITIIFELLGICITGTTSVLQHHIINGLLVCVGLIILYYYLISGKYSVRRSVAGISVLLIATMPSILTITLTQYYIELFGTICTLLALLKYDRWEKEGEEKNLYFSYLLLGLAFYSYFNFLFFLPAFILKTCYSDNHDSSKIRLLIRSFCFFIGGCSFYFIGYTQIWLRSLNITEPTRTSVLCFFVILLILSLIFWFRLSYSKMRSIGLFGILYGFLILWWVKYIYPAISGHVSALNIGGKKAGFLDRLHYIYQYFIGILSGNAAEEIIYKSCVTIASNSFVALLFLNIMILICFRMKKIKDQGAWKSVLGIILIYCSCSFLLSSRMQPQHFVPLVFITVVLYAYQLEQILNDLEKFRWIKKISYLVVTMLLCLNLVNETRIIEKIKITGGTDLYSNQINELSNVALKNWENNKKELYVFCEWGFMSGFNYLTQNRIPFTSNINLAAKYWEEGWDINICYWDKENEQKYRALLEETIKQDLLLSKEIYYQKNGEIAFYELKIEGQ